MTPAETLNAAADKLDALLAEATPYVPWTTHDDGLVWAPRLGDPVSGSLLIEDARYIAAMGPVVGRALVALLRHAARLVVQTNPTDSASVYRHDLDLARAILGGES